MIRDLIRLLPLPVKQFGKRIIGDRFQNDGGITDLDFEVMRRDIDRIRPGVFIELGTGTGVSTRKLFYAVRQQGLPFAFYTFEIFKRHRNAIRKAIPDPTFHPIWGFSVTREETTEPCHSQLEGYNGPQNILRTVLNTDLAGRKVDMAFIDSNKGCAVAEFKLLAERLSKDGVIFCHDILNRGKGAEVVEHLKTRSDFRYEVIDTGPSGIIRIVRA